MDRLLISVAQRRAILEDCARRMPDEACGLLIGTDGPDGIRIAEVVPAPNVDPAASDRFEIDPQILFATHRRLRGAAPLRLAGHYHSHPRGPAAPSATDRARAWEKGAVWLIAAGGEMRAFRFEDPDFAELAIAVEG